MPLLLRFFILSARWLAGTCTRRRRLQGAVYLRLCWAACAARARPVSGLTPLVRIRLVGRVSAPRQASRQPESGHSSPPYIRPSVPHTCLPFQKTTVADICPPPPVTVRVSGLKLIHTATPDTPNCLICVTSASAV